ncbi:MULTISPECIES: LacI family DNA-binding transcriptional regulator [Sanguibacter]|uniref:LacI family DNA-binding transcriptional regulator n=2 Tax=Sanguibacter TaxID=60919 RepID=A0A853EPJ4_9MICO|nr:MULTISPECIES: LacI family DNA-binding transcriptional regulator [Sanguibacter]KQT97872.1 LacI family transcriptional regulator [Sanguibacter sp. Leaf3]MBF0721295.1 LacI family DNA-binding transcriptional regulator [Sanguibacter inulinus]NYS92440.1 LacI family DNA-binding transcriptional regulator [Sanguibacter inulinus]WPF83659.1 LacI family DNA-binding transcriptional regulator [Sanguibacter sp. 4.1]
MSLIPPEGSGAGKTRLTDLAQQAGVSTATVSRVLNGKVGVASETRQAVLAALDVLGYERPEKLRNRSAGLVGLIVPELTNPVFPAFAQTIESMLSQRGYTPLLCTQSPGGTTEDEYIEMLLDHSIDGIIFVSGLHADTQASRERYDRLLARGIPLVFINGFASDIEAPFVSADDTAAMELSVRHLVSLGHQKIGLATGPDRFITARRKLEGFQDAVQRHLGIEDASPHVATSLFTVEGGQAAGGDLIDSGHTAIVCGSDLMALGVVRAAHQRRLTVPHDLSVVGYDDSPLIAFTDPPLTTVRQPVSAMCHAAISALVALLNGGSAPRSELLFHPELIVRNSTGASPDMRIHAAQRPS